MTHTADIPKAAHLPLVLLLGNHTEPLGAMKHQLENKFAIPVIAANADSLTLLDVRFSGLCRKYPSIRLVIISLRDFEEEAHQAVTTLLKAKLPVFAIIPIRKKLSSPIIDLSKLVAVRTFLEQHESHMEKLALEARELLNVTASIKASPNGSTSYAGGIARQPRNGNDEFTLNDADGGDDEAGDTDFSTIRKSGGQPKKAQLDAIESGVAIPKGLSAAMAKRTSSPKKSPVVSAKTVLPPVQTQPPAPSPAGNSPVEIPTFLATQRSATPKPPTTGSRVRPLLLPRPEPPPLPPDPIVTPTVVEPKPAQPPMAVQSKRKTMKNKPHTITNDDSAALIKQMQEGSERLLERRTSLMNEVTAIDDALARLAHISEIGPGQMAKLNAEDKARRKSNKKAAADKAPRRGKMGKKKSGKKPTDYKLHKGHEAVNIEGKIIIMPKGTAWTLKQLLAKPKTKIPDADLQNGKSLDMVVQRLIGIRKALTQRYGAKGPRALVTHPKEGHSLDLSLAR